MKRASLFAFLGLMLALCGLWAPDVVGHETTRATVLFDREIVRLLNRRCVMCHAQNSLAFPLETYEETWLRGRAIRAQLLARHMPPWAAVPGYGQFVNDNRLTLREIQFVVGWVESLGRRSAGGVFLNVVDPTATPRAVVRAEPHFDRWELGEPDLSWQLNANTVEAGTPQIKRTVVDLGLSQERFVRGLEFRPGDRRTVRAAFFSVQETGQWLGSWTPWYGFVDLPAGVAYRLRPRSHIVAEIHYQGTTEPVSDRSTLGIFFADRPARSSPSDLSIEATGGTATGGQPQRLTAKTLLARDTYVLALRPDVQPGITSVEVSAKRPDGRTDVIFFAKDFRLDWPTPYIYREPVLIPRGAELSVTAYSVNPPDGLTARALRLTLSTFNR